MNHSNNEPIKRVAENIDYDHAVAWLIKKGKSMYGANFDVAESDKALVKLLIAYFLNDAKTCDNNQISLQKGILLSGPVGCGKTTLMTSMRFYHPTPSLYWIKPCRDVSFEFIQDGYQTIQKYSKQCFDKHSPRTICFDDLGTENNLKYYGNECNVMAEILLSRYDLFVSHKMKTHITTNLSASEIETYYGVRVRSRMREMFNLIAFGKNTSDKRK